MLLDIVRENPDTFKRAFRYSPEDEVSANKLKYLCKLIPGRSPERRNLKNYIFGYFMDFVDSCEGNNLKKMTIIP